MEDRMADPLPRRRCRLHPNGRFVFAGKETIRRGDRGHAGQTAANASRLPGGTGSGRPVPYYMVPEYDLFDAVRTFGFDRCNADEGTE